MKRKSRSTTSTTKRRAWLWPAGTILALLVIWQILSMTGVVPSFMLPSPLQVVKAFFDDLPLLLMHSRATMIEALLGLVLGVAIGFGVAVVMDRFERVRQAVYPLVVITQTIPTVAIAPLLVLWFGYGILPKVVLIIIVTFFPVTVSLLSGFAAADEDIMNLMRSMGANRLQIFRYVKFPCALGPFFSSLRIAVSYAVVGAVISEWLGGFEGLGVYMTRVKSAFAFDKMFAVIFLISAVSLVMMWIVGLIERRCMPWTRVEEADKG